MSGGCTECANRGGCDHRKAGMFAAIDAALTRLYPSRRWGEMDDEAAFRAGVRTDEAAALADTLASRLRTLAVHVPGGPDDWSDFVYVLGMGRPPSAIEARLGIADPIETEADELYLRVALSRLGRLAAVQQVAMRMEVRGGDLVITESPRTGVWDPVLLPRYRQLAAALAEADVLNVDFGDITNPPDGFDDGEWPDRYGGRPCIANYLFFAEPAATVTITIRPLGPPSFALPSASASLLAGDGSKNEHGRRR